MAIPDWTKEDWAVLGLGGVTLPGTARVRITLESGLDIKKPKGGNKATLKDEGEPPASLEVELELLPEDIPAFQKAWPVLRPTSKRGARDPLAIVHPLATIAKITAVTVGKIELPMPDPGGSWKVRFTVHEWAPAPKPVKASKKKPKDKGTEGWEDLIQPAGGSFSSLPTILERSAPSDSGSALENLFDSGRDLAKSAEGLDE